MLGRITRTFLQIQGLLWLAFAIIRLRTEGRFTLMVLLLLLNGVAFCLAGLLFDKKRIFRIATLLFLVVNLLLSFTDQMGFFDWLVLVMNLMTITVAVAWLRSRGSE